MKRYIYTASFFLTFSSSSSSSSEEREMKKRDEEALFFYSFIPLLTWRKKERTERRIFCVASFPFFSRLFVFSMIAKNFLLFWLCKCSLLTRKCLFLTRKCLFLTLIKSTFFTQHTEENKRNTKTTQNTNNNKKNAH